MYMPLFAQAESRGVGPRKLIQHVEDRFDQIYRASTSAMTPAGRCARFLRSASYVGTLEGGEGWWNLDMTMEEARERNERYSGVPMAVNEPLFGQVADVFRPFAARYPGIRISLLVLGCVGALVMLRRGCPGLAGPFAFVLAYLAILTHLGQRELRYLIVLDVFCILQTAIAIGWRRPDGRFSPTQVGARGRVASTDPPEA
jgi:hypothetical protein